MTQNDQVAMNEQLTELRLNGLSIDGDNRYKTDLLNCVNGTLATGYQGGKAPPEGHWAWRFYEIGQATREDLARVEAERDAERARGDVAVGDANEAEAKLTEAVGLLAHCADWCISAEAENKAKDFLARHAQVGQQAAHEPSAAEAIDSLTQPLCVISLRGDDRQKALATDLAKIINQYHGHDQEAQGAQAEPANFGQELEAFEKWRRTQADSLRRCGHPDGAAAFIRLGSVQWAGWQARATLASQPAEVDSIASALEVMAGFTGEDWSEMYERFPALAEQFNGYASRKVAEASGPCRLPPAGWECSRKAGHEGSCAAFPITQPALGEPVYQYMGLCREWVECKQSFYEYQRNHGYKVRTLYAAPSATPQSNTIKLPPAPYVGPEGSCELTSYEQGELQGRCDMWELIRKMNETPTAAHGDESVASLLPGLQWAIDYCNAMLRQGNDRMLVEVIRNRLENVLSNQPAAMRAQGAVQTRPDS